MMNAILSIFNTPKPWLNKACFVLACGFVTVICQANEQDTGFYTGAGVSNIATEEGGESSRDFGFSFLVGFQQSQYLGYEFSLVDIGEHEEMGMKGNGMSLSVIGQYPLSSHWKVLGEFGGITIDLDIDEAQNAASAVELEDGSDRSFFYALGVQYRMKEWSFVLKNSQIDLDADLNATFAQVRYHF
ncbi:outer membrane beta-barrel protein [Bermanella sp. R86510]|uniref:outer membrane beta-barrel protein n=1 Tax=unclassified Bermanella TaxID=2627862 RepID=UPI0037C876BC